MGCDKDVRQTARFATAEYRPRQVPTSQTTPWAPQTRGSDGCDGTKGSDKPNRRARRVRLQQAADKFFMIVLRDEVLPCAEATAAGCGWMGHAVAGATRYNKSGRRDRHYDLWRRGGATSMASMRREVHTQGGGQRRDDKPTRGATDLRRGSDNLGRGHDGDVHLPL